MFGLTGAQANHGEDVKEYWWYLDALPSHAWNRWRYHYPQARVPLRGPAGGERPAGQARPRVRAARHRGLRRRPVLDRRGPLRQGRPDRPADGDQRHQRRAGRRHPARAADRLVPQHLVLGRRRPQAGHGGHRRRPRSASSTRSSARWSWLADTGAGRRRADPAVLRERDQHGAAVRRRAGAPRTPRTGSTTTWSAARRPSTRSGAAPSAPSGTSCTVAAGRHGRAAAPAAPGGKSRAARRVRQELRARSWTPGAAEADEFYAELTPAGASADEALVMRQAFAGMLWSKQLYYYDVAPLAGRRPGPAAAARVAPVRAQLPLAQLRRLRHHVDAGQVGVPVVRGLGPGLPLRGAGPRRPGLRQVPADPAVPGVVPAPERRAARLRVGLRRRQPAGAGLGRAGGVRHRRRPRLRLPRAGSSTSCWSTSPGG